MRDGPGRHLTAPAMGDVLDAAALVGGRREMAWATEEEDLGTPVLPLEAKGWEDQQTGCPVDWTHGSAGLLLN